MERYWIWCKDHPHTVGWLLFVSTVNTVINILQIVGILG